MRLALIIYYDFLNIKKIVLVITLALLLISCKDNLTDPPVKPINPNIVHVRPHCINDWECGNFIMGVWYDVYIFASQPNRRLKLDKQFKVLEDSLIYEYEEVFTYISVNKLSTKALGGKRRTYSYIYSSSLSEINLQNFSYRLLRDSSHNISSAVYLNDDTKCIYHSYGNASINKQPGFYFFDISSDTDSLLFTYASELGPYEILNGFDVSPDNQYLLFPVHFWNNEPKIVKYDLQTKKFDTLNLKFDRQLLWLRFNNAGNQILYSNYPVGAWGPTVGTDSEIGVVELNSLKKRVLDVIPRPGWKINTFPSWSPDNKHIVYSSAKGPTYEPPGGKGSYILYILKYVNQ